MWRFLERHCVALFTGVVLALLAPQIGGILAARIRAGAPLIGSPAATTVEIMGTVVGPDGAPAARVRVQVVGWRHRSLSLRTYHEGTSRDDGTFEFRLERAGRSVPSVTIRARDETRDLVGWAVVQDRSPGFLTIRLARAAYVHTRVLDRTRRPVRGVAIDVTVTCNRVWSSWAPAISDEHGDILLGPLPPDVTLRIRPTLRIAAVALNPGSWQSPRAALRLSPGQRVELPPLLVDLKGRAAEGVVWDAAGRPASGAKVTASLNGGNARLALTDRQGHFRLTGLGLRGEVWLVATDASESVCACTRLDPDKTRRVRLVLPPTDGSAGPIRMLLPPSRAEAADRHSGPRATASASPRPSAGDPPRPRRIAATRER